MPISGIELHAELGAIQRAGSAEPAEPGFAEQLSEMLSKVNGEMARAESATGAFAAGETNNLHETILAAEKAVIAFKLVGAVRNRVLEAYHEVMRMSV